jgi:predicted dinucleotide-binding enzyme
METGQPIPIIRSGKKRNNGDNQIVLQERSSAMNEKNTILANFSAIFRFAAIIFAILTFADISLPAAAEDLVSKKQLKIGVIGSGRIGGTLGELWVKAGHEVLFSSRHPDELQELAERLGPTARAGMPLEAAAFGEVILISIPYHAVPQVGRDLQRELAGKVVLETGNPYPSRDGDMAVTARTRGTGLSSAEFLPGVRLVRAFNSVGHNSLRSEAHRPGDRVAIPLAGDDPQALAVASRLVKDAGFEPVVVGPLFRAKEFDVGTAVYGQALTARELRQKLGVD